jgi:spore maturation protein CgeB
MRALVIGPKVAGYHYSYNQSVVWALKQYGFDTQISEFYVTTPPGLVNRIRIDAAMVLKYDKYYQEYIKSFNQNVLDLYNKTRPDLVFVNRGNKLAATTLKSMSSSIRVLWCQDAVHRCDLTPEQLHEYDRIYVFEANDVPWVAQHFNLEAKFLPMGLDPEIYHPLPTQDRDIDLFFVGKYYPERRTILERLAQDFPDKKLCFYGRYVRYREPVTWARFLYYGVTGKGKTFINRNLNPSEINRLYSRSKICLNIHHSQSDLGCNPRVFEIMGSQSFQLVDSLSYVKEKFADIVGIYDGYEQLREAISYYLNAPQLCDQMAVQSYEIALENHTYAHRIQTVLDDFNLLKKSEE